MSCKYCDEDRLIDQGSIYFGEMGKIACINSQNELVVNINGEQINVPIKYCPWCGSSLNEGEKSIEQLKADLRGKDNEIEMLKSRIKYLQKFKPNDDVTSHICCGDPPY